MKSLIAMVVIVTAGAMSMSAEGTLVEFETPTDAEINGLPVNAFVTFEITGGHITITLENRQQDPTSVAQNLSSLSFEISSGETAGTLASSLGTPRWVSKPDGAYVDDAPGSTGWELGTSGSLLVLNVLGTAVGPAHTIIGPPDGSDKYGSGNGSIQGNPPHNPFLAESATFELDIPGVIEASTISLLIFGFNTTGTDTVDVPEPTTLCLLGGMTAAWAMLQRKRTKKAKARA